ncbi:MAG: ribosome biogenesis GTPase YlqF [Gammaproteobacteria bacterium]|nr:ribosome biogenesis GTPase YlqF [Gammaproteobacteria bacterium]
MSIQWYPGHMHKAQKEIKKALPKIDVIIEVIDARIPFSSANPVIASLAAINGMIKPIIKVINKVDLADPETTQLWCDYLESQENIKALTLSVHKTDQVKKIITLCHQLAPQRLAKDLPVRAMIMGIPNVGKSTIINALMGRTIAKVGNEPAVTQRQQRIDLPNNVTLFDTPGFLWPKIDNENSSYRLAITGAIKDTALEYDDIAFYAIDYIKENFPEELQKHFKLEQLDSETIDIIEAIGRKRGCLMAGGRINLDKVSKIIIKEIRAASLGSLSFETPTMIEAEMKVVEEIARQKQEKQATRKNSFKSKQRRR